MEHDEFSVILNYLSKNRERPWEIEADMAHFLDESKKLRLVELGRTPLPTEYGPMTYIVFGDYATGKEHDEDNFINE
jgi:hypothetical protein